jgi:hypothetical protein
MAHTQTPVELILVFFNPSLKQNAKYKLLKEKRKRLVLTIKFTLIASSWWQTGTHKKIVEQGRSIFVVKLQNKTKNNKHKKNVNSKIICNCMIFFFDF